MTLLFEDAAKVLAASMKVAFGHDRKLRIGASEIGQCARRVAYDKLGFDPDRDVTPDNGFSVRGNVMENNWSAPLVEQWAKMHGGEMLYGGQENQVSLTGKKTPLSATPDGLCIGMKRNCLAPYGLKDIGASKKIVAELKSLDPRVNEAKLPKPPHIPQTMTQLGLIRLATEHKPEYGFVLYVDASDYFKCRPYIVKWDERAFKSLVARASMIMATKDPNQLLPEGKLQGGTECNECPFSKRCLGYAAWIHEERPGAVKGAALVSIKTQAQKLKAAKAKEADAAQSTRDAEAALYLTLNKHKTGFVKGKGFTVVAKRNASQNRLDAKKLAAMVTKLGGDPETCRSSTKEGTSLTVEFA